jgi:hypothetical protein
MKTRALIVVVLFLLLPRTTHGWDREALAELHQRATDAGDATGPGDDACDAVGASARRHPRNTGR